MRLSRYIDKKLIAMILGSPRIPFSALPARSRACRLKNMDLSVFAKPLFAYVCLCRRLAQWHDSHTDIIAKPIMVGGHQVTASFADE